MILQQLERTSFKFACLQKHRRHFSASRAQFGLEKERVRNQHGTEYDLVRTNVKQLEEYYSKQKACTSETEWQECLRKMRTDLPQSFRLNTSRPQTSARLKQLLRTKFWQKSSQEMSLRSVSADEMVQQVDGLSRWDLNGVGTVEERSSETEAFHEFLYRENALGNVARQELVSMAPVSLLDIQSHHRVLDMCASPGSKTRQVIEALHRNCENNIPEGFVIANEYNPGRCFRLVKNIQAYASPCWLVTNEDAATFPDVLSGEGGERVQFDRIVCDQPCSGDGTVRKNPNVWLSWSPSAGNQLHNLQYDIARRGVEMLAVDGMFAYSSCAMNPIENEAVLLRLLRESRGTLELVDTGNQLFETMGMKCAPGFTTWSVFDNKMMQYESIEEVPESQRGLMLHAGMFPMGADSYAEQLSRCMRFLPHHNDDGGFFVAILRKKAPMPWESESIAPVTGNRLALRKGNCNPQKAPVSEMNDKKVDHVWKAKSHFLFLNEDEPAMSAVKHSLDFHGLQDLDPSLLFGTKSRKKLLLANQAVKGILLGNKTWQLNIAQAGMRCLKKTKLDTNPVDYDMFSIPSDSFFLSRMSKRVVKIGRADMLSLLSASSSLTLILEEEEDECVLSPEACVNFLAMTKAEGPGAVKLALEEEEGQAVECLAYLGERTIVINVSSSQRYHCKLVLQN